MNKVEVCLTPELIHQHDLAGKVVVVVDIFRATSCMVSGLATGVKSIEPVAEVNECLAGGKKGRVMAGERGGEKVEGFDIGNSPYEYMCDEVKGREVTVTTTNGTQAIVKSIGAYEILIGAFLNISAVARQLAECGKDVIIHCAGWKGTVNLEDTLFAGALIDRLTRSHEILGDPALVAKAVFDQNRNNLLGAARESSHAHRLCGFGVEKDLEYCLRQDEFDVVPVWKDGVITTDKPIEI